MTGRNTILLAAAAMIAIVPLFMGFEGDEIFGGADDQAKGVIGELQPGYEPWFQPLWEPPSGEIGSLLFALQAALGAGFLGYYFGLRRGEAKGRRPTADHADR